MQKAKKLIEVALPIKEISAESVRDKSIRHGHISTLHLWWARRPLPVCRAIVFASLVPDPLDDNCPEAFQYAVEMLLNTGLGKIHYKPYDKIPYISAGPQMEDNHRNRLMMFIGKFSEKCKENMLAGKTTSPKEQLDVISNQNSLRFLILLNNKHQILLALCLLINAGNSIGKYHLATAVTTTVLMASVGSSSQKGISLKQLKLCLLKPDAFQHIDIDSTLNQLENIVHYMYRSSIGEEQSYRFQSKPNINILINQAKGDVKEDEVNAEILRLVKHGVQNVAQVREALHSVQIKRIIIPS